MVWGMWRRMENMGALEFVRMGCRIIDITIDLV